MKTSQKYQVSPKWILSYRTGANMSCYSIQEDDTGGTSVQSMSSWTMTQLDQRSWKELAYADSVVRMVKEQPAEPAVMLQSAITW